MLVSGRVHFLKLTAKAPEHGWLRDDPFILGFGLFSGGELLVSGRVTSVFFFKVMDVIITVFHSLLGGGLIIYPEAWGNDPI